MTSAFRLGERLVASGHVNLTQLETALVYQRRRGGYLGEILVELGYVGEDTVLTELAAQLGVPYLADLEVEVPTPVLRLLPERLIRARRLLPLGLATDSVQRTLVVASADPGDLAALDEAAFATGSNVKAVLVPRRALDRAIERHLGRPSDRALAVVVALPKPPQPRPPVIARREPALRPCLPALAAGG